MATSIMQSTEPEAPLGNGRSTLAQGCGLIGVGVIAVAAIALILPAACTSETTSSPAAPRPISIASPNCGEVVGMTQTDANRAAEFCARGIVPGTVVGVIAMESIATVKVTEAFARELLEDTLRSEQLVKGWMRGWRATTGLKSVTVEIEWGDVRVATGDTTMTGADRVTFR